MPPVDYFHPCNTFIGTTMCGPGHPLAPWKDGPGPLARPVAAMRPAYCKKRGNSNACFSAVGGAAILQCSPQSSSPRPSSATPPLNVALAHSHNKRRRGSVGGLRRSLCALKHEQHVLIARARLTKGDEWLILRRVVPGVELIHVRELDDDNALWLPMAALRQFVG
jgi:hypothetical protein